MLKDKHFAHIKSSSTVTGYCLNCLSNVSLSDVSPVWFCIVIVYVSSLHATPVLLSARVSAV